MASLQVDDAMEKGEAGNDFQSSTSAVALQPTPTNSFTPLCAEQPHLTANSLTISKGMNKYTSCNEIALTKNIRQAITNRKVAAMVSKLLCSKTNDN